MKNIILLLSISFVFSATLRVPLDFPTIQDAIASHATNDTILVASGLHEIDGYYALISNTMLTIISEQGSDSTFLTTTDSINDNLFLG